MINYYKIQLGFGEGGSRGSYDRNIKKQNLFEAAVGFFLKPTLVCLISIWLQVGRRDF